MPRFAANLSLLFTEVPLQDRFAAAHAAGFPAVEMQFPYAEAKAVLAARLTETGLPLVLHNLPPATGPQASAASPPCPAVRPNSARASPGRSIMRARSDAASSIASPASRRRRSSRPAFARRSQRTSPTPPRRWAGRASVF